MPSRPADSRPPDAVPGDDPQPSNQPIEEMVNSEALDLGVGPDQVVDQQNVSPGNEQGGGEWPDPTTPPSEAAPGSAGMGPDRSGGPSQFKETQESDRE